MTEELLARLLERTENRYYGKYRGFVVDNADPQKRGRLRVKVPSVFGTDVVSGWALPCAPYGGADDQGLFFVPEVEAGVWVEFEAGDLEYPVWVGTFWSKPGGNSEAPKPNKPDGTKDDAAQSPPTRKIIKTVKGHTIQLEDKDGEEMLLVVEAKNNHVVRMDKDGVKLTEGTKKHVVAFDKDGIKVTHGENSNEVFISNDGIKVTDAKNGNSVEMSASGMTITDGASAVTVKDKNGNQLVLDSAGISAADKNGNKLVLDAGGVVVQEKANKVVVGAAGVSIGSDGAAEPLVLGNQLDLALKSFLMMLNTHTHGTSAPGAPTTPPAAPMQLVLTPALSKAHKVDK